MCVCVYTHTWGGNGFLCHLLSTLHHHVTVPVQRSETTLRVLGLELRLADLYSKHFYLGSHLVSPIFTLHMNTLALTAIRKRIRIVSCNTGTEISYKATRWHTPAHNSRLRQKNSWFETSTDLIRILYIFLL